MSFVLYRDVHIWTVKRRVSVGNWSELVNRVCIWENGMQVWTAWVNRLNGVCKCKNEICTFDLVILLRDVSQLTGCFICKMFARLWMRHIHENEVCTCEPVNRVRSCLQNLLLWMECTCVNGTGETYKCVRICKTPAHLWMEISLCEGELAVENRATYLLTGYLRCESLYV